MHYPNNSDSYYAQFLTLKFHFLSEDIWNVWHKAHSNERCDNNERKKKKNHIDIIHMFYHL